MPALRFGSGSYRRSSSTTDCWAAADEWCSRIGNLPPHAVAMTKPLLRATADADWNAALTLEEFAEPTCFTTAAFAESVQAMLK